MSLIKTYQKHIAVFVMVVAMSFGFFTAAANHAFAEQLPVLDREYELTTLQTEEEFRAILIDLIKELLAQIATLQTAGGQSAVGPVSNNSVITLDSTIATTDNLSVRGTPAGTLLRVVPANTSGRVLAGPQLVEGRNWWRVAYASGVTGWSAGNWLTQVQTAVAPEDTSEDEMVEQTLDTDEVVRKELFCDVRNRCGSNGRQGNFFAVEVDEIEYERSANGEAATYQFELEITAREGDLFIEEDSFQAMVSIGEKAMYMADEDVVSIVTEETSAETNKISGDRYYVIEEGDTERFVITIYYDPVVEGNYLATLYGFDFRLGDSKPYSLDLWPERPDTESVPITGLSYEAWLKGTDETDDAETAEIRDKVAELIAEIDELDLAVSTPSERELSVMTKSELQTEINRLLAIIAAEETTEGAESLRVRSSSDNPNASSFQIEANGESNEYSLLAFELDARDSERDLLIEEIVLDFDISNGRIISDIIDAMSITLDGQRVGHLYLDDTEVVFTPNFTVAAGDTVTVVFTASFMSAKTGIVGTSFDVSVESVQVQGANADFLADGSAYGKTHRLVGAEAIRLTDWGAELVESEADIPTNKFRAYWIEADTLEERLSSEIVETIYFDYITYGRVKHRGDRPSAYWVGNFELPANRNIYFNMSDPGWDRVELYIDGVQQPIDDDEVFKFTTRRSDTYTIEVLYESEWHAGEF